MKRAFLILTIFLLSGCIVEEDHNYRVLYPTAGLVGDSLCAAVWDTEKEIKHLYENDYDLETAGNIVGIVSMCVRGRKLMDIEELPTGFKVLFLALGTNDIGRTSLDDFRIRYQFLVYNSDAEHLYCVLPNKIVRGLDTEPYRNIIRETCNNIIDPLEYGVRFRAGDTTHMTRLDHRLATAYIIEVLKYVGLMA